VLQLRQRLCFARDVGRDLKGHISVVQITLASQEDPGEGSFAEFTTELETQEVRSDPWEGRHRTYQPLRGVRVSAVQGAKKFRPRRSHVLRIAIKI
jgi:hypothetical protein